MKCTDFYVHNQAEVLTLSNEEKIELSRARLLATIQYRQDGVFVKGGESAAGVRLAPPGQAGRIERSKNYREAPQTARQGGCSRSNRKVFFSEFEQPPRLRR